MRAGCAGSFSSAWAWKCSQQKGGWRMWRCWGVLFCLCTVALQRNSSAGRRRKTFLRLDVSHPLCVRFSLENPHKCEHIGSNEIINNVLEDALRWGEINFLPFPNVIALMRLLQVSIRHLGPQSDFCWVWCGFPSGSRWNKIPVLTWHYHHREDFIWRNPIDPTQRESQREDIVCCCCHQDSSRWLIPSVLT